MKHPILKAGLAGLAGALAGLAATLIPGRKITPEERERRRRALVNREGKTGNATVLDYTEGVVCYTYRVGRIEYTAYQDLGTLQEWLPPTAALLPGRPATLKYLPHNAANSILLCEEWTGFQFLPQPAPPGRGAEQ